MARGFCSAFLFLISTLQSSSSTEIDPTVTFSTTFGDPRTVVCKGVAVPGQPTCRPHPVVGLTAIPEEGSDGLFLDPDDDGQFEWECDENAGNTGGVAVEDLTAEMLYIPPTLSCIEAERAGPSSDSFLLTDGITRVERIDIDGDRAPDLVKVGDDVRPVATTRTLVSVLLPAAIAALVAGVFGFATKGFEHWLKKRES